jgi:hypothetical protein
MPQEKSICITSYYYPSHAAQLKTALKKKGVPSVVKKAVSVKGETIWGVWVKDSKWNKSLEVLDTFAPSAKKNPSHINKGEWQAAHAFRQLPDGRVQILTNPKGKVPKDLSITLKRKYTKHRVR